MQKRRPVQQDVNKIKRAVGVDFTQGRIITYKTIEQITGIKQHPCRQVLCKRVNSRWVNVTKRWRDQVEQEHNIVVGTVRGEGFIFMTDLARMNFAQNQQKRGLRHIARSLDLAKRNPCCGLLKAERVVNKTIIKKDKKLLAV